MLDKCREGTRYIYPKQFKSTLVSNAFSAAYARRDECKSSESRPVVETIMSVSPRYFEMVLDGSRLPSDCI